MDWPVEFARRADPRDARPATVAPRKQGEAANDCIVCDDDHDSTYRDNVDIKSNGNLADVTGRARSALWDWREPGCEEDQLG